MEKHMHVVTNLPCYEYICRQKKNMHTRTTKEKRVSHHFPQPFGLGAGWIVSAFIFSALAVEWRTGRRWTFHRAQPKCNLSQCHLASKDSYLFCQWHFMA